MIHRLRHIVMILALLACAAMAQTESDALRQSLRHRGFVNDFAGVIADAQERQLEAVLNDLHRKTQTAIVVATVDDMRGGEVNDFANRLYEQWGIGTKGQDKGALLLAAIQDRKARIEVGYGLEGLIPDARAGRILDQAVIPLFKQNRYGEGLLNGAVILARRVADDAGVSLGERMASQRPQSTRRRGFSWFHLLIFIFLIPVIIRHPWLLLFMLSGRGGGFSGGGFGGGGFSGGGFGGGLSGGGGASRGW